MLAFGHLLYRHRILALVAWAVVLAAAAASAPRIFSVLAAGGFSSRDLETSRVDDLLAERFNYNPATLYVVFEDPRGVLTATDPAFRGAVGEALRVVPDLPEVAHVALPDQNARQIARDGRTAYAVIALRSIPEDFRHVLPVVQGAIRPTELRTTLTGAPVFYADIQEVTERDLQRAEILSFPFAGLALILVFGSLVAAVLPGLLGGVSVVVTLGVMVGLTRFVDLSVFSLNLTTMLGLGLGIDYSLFVVSRFREELAARGDVEEAVAWSVATAGRAVLFSGGTVFLGLLGLLLFEFQALRSLGIAGTLVVAVSVLGALTLLPAMLGLLGTRVNALRIPFIGLQGDRSSASGLWSRLAGLVMARPLTTLVPLLVVLIAMGLPFLRVQFGAPDASILPPDVQSRQGFDLLREHWGEGELSPILVTFRTTDGGAPLRAEHVGALYDFLQRVKADPRAERVESIVTIDARLSQTQYQALYASPDPARIPDFAARTAALNGVRGDVAVARVTSRFGQTDDRSKALVRAIRNTAPPAGFAMLVGGGTAGVIDYADRLYADFPRAALVVVASTYLVLLWAFRSVVLPLKAIVMNALSLLASYGALVVVFQEGFGASVLGFRPLGFVEASLPIVMFCVLFGLSMDYEVFLLSRVKEAHDAGLNNRESVAQGMERSGRIITSAASIVVLVSLSFVAADIVLIKALGLGTAIAVFLDASIVRALVVPATMRLLGQWNWWAPAWLDRRTPGGTTHAS